MNVQMNLLHLYNDFTVPKKQVTKKVMHLVENQFVGFKWTLSENIQEPVIIQVPNQTRDMLILNYLFSSELVVYRELPLLSTLNIELIFRNHKAI